MYASEVEFLRWPSVQIFMGARISNGRTPRKSAFMSTISWGCKLGTFRAPSMHTPCRCHMYSPAYDVACRPRWPSSFRLGTRWKLEMARLGAGSRSASAKHTTQCHMANLGSARARDVRLATSAGAAHKNRHWVRSTWVRISLPAPTGPRPLPRSPGS